MAMAVLSASTSVYQFQEPWHAVSGLLEFMPSREEKFTPPSAARQMERSGIGESRPEYQTQSPCHHVAGALCCVIFEAEHP